jgi:hypothetical protein
MRSSPKRKAQIPGAIGDGEISVYVKLTEKYRRLGGEFAPR